MKFTVKFIKLTTGTSKIFSGAFFIYLLVYFFTPVNIFPRTNPSENYRYKLNKFNAVHFLQSINKNILKDDSIKKKSEGKVVFKMKKSPWKAVTYSAILPGAGQFYNQSYWKIPVIAGIGGYFVYEFVKNNNNFLDFKRQYISSQTPENPNGDPQLLAFREFYRDQRDNFIIYSVILYVVNLIDAYVDAQLYDFDVSDNIKLSILKKDKILKLSYSF